MNFQIRFEGTRLHATWRRERKSLGSQNLNDWFERSKAGNPHLLSGWQSLQMRADSNQENNGAGIVR
jgi:hypothetical protein